MPKKEDICMVPESKKNLWKGMFFVALASCVILMIILALFVADEQKESSKQTGIANPASVFCEQRGYNLTIITAPDGSQLGYCVFPDGNRCEEWVFYRGECSESAAVK